MMREIDVIDDKRKAIIGTRLGQTDIWVEVE